MCKDKKKHIPLGFANIESSAGAHICFIYQDEHERRSFMSKYIESGLLINEKIAYFADLLSPKELESWLLELGIEMPDPKQIDISKTADVYFPDGSFKFNNVLEKLVGFYHSSTDDQGYAGVRITGEMGWATRSIPGCEDLIEYEARVNRVVDNTPITALCQYDATKFDGDFIYDILQVHPLMVIRGQVVKNPAYTSTDEFLAAYHQRHKHDK
ncbi:MEDS domain-containing protein [Thiotrichales bacterium 19S11-10]|nr:MEDS domain-containing protein [Thiotrichales bacterium 19S11-10]